MMEEYDRLDPHLEPIAKLFTDFVSLRSKSLCRLDAPKKVRDSDDYKNFHDGVQTLCRGNEGKFVITCHVNQVLGPVTLLEQVP